ncbi:uncharacterized protein [Nicotiana sylvestris]|uniref:uncharacterized protein n=1 Tax=Nicotiana sylvestris TaxID=4096 RepID=UPI00388CBF9C
MVLEKENWLILPSVTTEVVSFAGLVGDGAALIVSSETSPDARLPRKSVHLIQTDSKRNGFSSWLKGGNPFLPKLNGSSKEYLDSCLLNGSATQESGNSNEDSFDKSSSLTNSDVNHVKGNASLSEDENEDLHADFIDEDSQLPSRIAKPGHSRNRFSHWNNEQIKAQTGSSLSLLRKAKEEGE